jgi:hypothetical protein
MPADRPTVEIRSYRSVFDLERRLYRIDRFRLNPSGVPVRGLVCVALLVGAVLVVQRLPGVGTPVRVLPWQLRYATLPGGGAALLTMLRIDGRTAQAALGGVMRFALGPRHLSRFERCPGPGACWTPPPLVAIDDEVRGGTVRFRGPGAVLIRGAHRLERRGAGRRLQLVVRPADQAGRVLVVKRGVTLHVRSARRR